jgi:hypothetical protein
MTGIIRNQKWKKDKQYNGQKKKDKRTNNYLKQFELVFPEIKYQLI